MSIIHGLLIIHELSTLCGGTSVLAYIDGMYMDSWVMENNLVV